MSSISRFLFISAKSRQNYTHSAFTSKPTIGFSHRHQTPRKIQDPKALIPVIRARIDKSGFNKPGPVVETENLAADVRKRAMDAIDACGNRVTIGDVANRAGLNLDESQKALRAIASDTNGFLEVSDEGDVLYAFPNDYRSKLVAKSFWIKIEPLVEKSKSAAEYLIRVSFGTTLIASIVIVSTAIIVLLLASDNGGSGGGGGSSSSTSNSSSSHWIGINHDSNRMSFNDSVFSFVFGDGDPNQGSEEERWKLIGQYIASNGGVVTAEELAPYLDLHSTTEKDESYILPVLLRFDGQPNVDEEGNILYWFPSLQRTASSSGRKEENVAETECFFREKKWEFSKTNISRRAVVIGLGALNLFVVIILHTILSSTPITHGGFIIFVTYIFPFLWIYAAAFFVVPLVRWLVIFKTNMGIEKRNQKREQCARSLELPNPCLQKKLLRARDMAEETVIGKDRIVFSTEGDMLEQDYETHDWDHRFQEIEKMD